MNYDPHSRGTYLLGVVGGILLVYLAIILTPASMNVILFALPGAGVFWWSFNKFIWSYIDPIVQRYRDDRNRR